MTWAHLRHLDAPDALTYLEKVKTYLASDLLAFNTVLRQVDSLIANNSSDPAFVQSVVTIATILKKNPRLFHGLNSVLRGSNRIECSTQVDEVDLFVIVTPTTAKICSASFSRIEEPSTAEELVSLLQIDLGWETVLNKQPCKSWLTCISQLLQVILDDPKTEASCRRKVYRCLRQLAHTSSILPPSLFLNNIERDTGFPVQGGAFADIYKGVVKETPICFRVLRMFDMPQAERDELYKDFCQEVLVWRQLKHPNILPFLGANTTSFSPQFCFISYWMNNGDIMAYLKRNPDHDRFMAVAEIVEGIEYLHGLDPPVTHKDIKGANVLVTDNLTCCLADFGLSSILESQRFNNRSPTPGGSVCWLAPELMHESNSLSKKDAKAADIFSLACTIFEIFTGKPPHSNLKTSATVMFAVCAERRPPIPPPESTWTAEENELWWLVGQCWKQKPEDRPEIHLIKAHLKEIADRKKVQEDLRTPSPSISGVDPEIAAADELDNVRVWLHDELSRMYDLPLQQGDMDDDSSIIEEGQVQKTWYPQSRPSPPPSLNLVQTDTQYINGLATPTTPSLNTTRRPLPPLPAVPISRTSGKLVESAFDQMRTNSTDVSVDYKYLEEICYQNSLLAARLDKLEAKNSLRKSSEDDEVLSPTFKQRLRSYTPGLQVPTPPTTPSPHPASHTAVPNRGYGEFNSPLPIHPHTVAPGSPPTTATPIQRQRSKSKASAALRFGNQSHLRAMGETRSLSPPLSFRTSVCSPLRETFLIVESDLEGDSTPSSSISAIISEQPSKQDYDQSHGYHRRDVAYPARSPQLTTRTTSRLHNGDYSLKQFFRASTSRPNIPPVGPSSRATRIDVPQTIDFRLGKTSSSLRDSGTV